MPVRVCVNGCQRVRPLMSPPHVGGGVSCRGTCTARNNRNALTRRNVPQGPNNMPPGRRVETSLAGGAPVPQRNASSSPSVAVVGEVQVGHQAYPTRALLGDAPR